ncbi:DUF418 domain-containing protein [Micromonospora sonneratiae]|uniref:DUF418 domain-containing protein n=1 Tax=Micromonospora sonneratiae TaxID=1184706 RepID=A0ABW3YCC9_9ACTN
MTSRPEPDVARTGRLARGGVRPDERALAPDLARGCMLLLIVLSNTAFHLWAARHGASGWHPVDGSPLDRAVQFLMITMLDLRVYPLFAFLFGYGMMQLFLRQTAAGTTDRTAARLVRRRGLWLIVFGFAHAALLMAGDIIGSYGLMSLVLGWLFIRRGNRTLLVWASIAVAVLVVATVPAIHALLTGGLGELGEAGTEPSTVFYAAGEADLFAAVGTRLATWSFVTLGGGLLSAPGYAMMLLAFLAARRRVLEEPGKHLRLLRWTAVIGVTVGWLGGLPAALAHIGVWQVPPAAVSETGALRLIQDGTGIGGGLGYVALFALIAYRLSGRTRQARAVVAVAAVGRRSLSSYLTHSLIFSPLLAAWGLGLGASLGSTTMAMFGVAVWLVTVVGAYVLDRTGRSGPAEALLRRLVYGRVGRGPADPPSLTPVGSRPGVPRTGVLTEEKSNS